MLERDLNNDNFINLKFFHRKRLGQPYSHLCSRFSKLLCHIPGPRIRVRTPYPCLYLVIIASHLHKKAFEDITLHLVASCLIVFSHNS